MGAADPGDAAKSASRALPTGPTTTPTSAPSCRFPSLWNMSSTAASVISRKTWSETWAPIRAPQLNPAVPMAHGALHRSSPRRATTNPVPNSIPVIPKPPLATVRTATPLASSKRRAGIRMPSRFERLGTMVAHSSRHCWSSRSSPVGKVSTFWRLYCSLTPMITDPILFGRGSMLFSVYAAFRTSCPSVKARGELKNRRRFVGSMWLNLMALLFVVRSSSCRGWSCS
mmetsp:Transcript_11012/g.26450  ORF Transcript_11012/g.26450 Transcript_11012/m.26450 type:complete len:228 (+) Transcript_11012:589-1272(+)